MSNIVKFDSYKNRIICEEVGTVCISMYEDKSTGLPFFYVDPDCENVLHLCDVIETALENYKSE